MCRFKQWTTHQVQLSGVTLKRISQANTQPYGFETIRLTKLKRCAQRAHKIFASEKMFTLTDLRNMTMLPIFVSEHHQRISPCKVHINCQALTHQNNVHMLYMCSLIQKYISFCEKCTYAVCSEIHAFI